MLPPDRPASSGDVLRAAAENNARYWELADRVRTLQDYVREVCLPAGRADDGGG
tara:strand:- start:1406 stop:1567 length:162 start_codon:yes stop_codon:yes gene_type:complete